MKITIIGKRKLNFKSDKGEMISGYSIFTVGDNPDVEGQIADKTFISEKSPVYGEIVKLNFSKGPINADFFYDRVPGSKNPVLSSIVVSK